MGRRPSAMLETDEVRGLRETMSENVEGRPRAEASEGSPAFRAGDDPAGRDPGADAEPDTWPFGLLPAQEEPAPRRRGPRALRLVRARRGRTGLLVLSVAGITALALASVIAVGLVLAKTRADDAVAQRQAAAYTPPPIATASPLLGSVAIIGDESVSRSASGVPSGKRWPALAQASLGTNVTTLAAPGSGYVKRGEGQRTFVERAAEIPEDAQVVVFMGGSNDAGVSSAALAHAATTAFSAVNERAPNARIVVIGPVAAGPATYDELFTVTRALEASAAVAHARWVDPIAADWLPDSSSVALGALSAADERALASRAQALLDPLIG